MATTEHPDSFLAILAIENVYNYRMRDKGASIVPFILDLLFALVLRQLDQLLILLSLSGRHDLLMD